MGFKAANWCHHDSRVQSATGSPVNGERQWHSDKTAGKHIIQQLGMGYDDVIIWKHFPRYCHLVRAIFLGLVDSPHKDSDAELWCCGWNKNMRLNKRLSNRDAGDLRRHRAHYDVIVRVLMKKETLKLFDKKKYGRKLLIISNFIPRIIMDVITYPCCD